MQAKFVNEYNFERGLDPKAAMGIGIQHEIESFMEPFTNMSYIGGKEYALQHYAEQGKLKHVKCLIEMMETSPDGFESKPLRFAVLNDHKDIVKYLLRKGAKVTAYIFKLSKQNDCDDMAQLLWPYYHEKIIKNRYPKPIKESMNEDEGWIDVEENDMWIDILYKHQISENEDEIDETHRIDPFTIDMYIGKKIGLNIQDIANGELMIHDIKKIDDGEWVFITNYGERKMTLGELEKLVK